MNSPMPTAKEQFWMCYRIACLPVALSSLLLMWPIEMGNAQSGTMTPLSFCIFQAIYIAIAVPVTLLIFDFSLPGCPRKGKVAICILTELTAFTFFFLYHYYHPQSRFTLTRTLAPVFGDIFVAAGYFVYWRKGYDSWLEANKYSSCLFASGPMCQAQDVLLQESKNVMRNDSESKSVIDEGEAPTRAKMLSEDENQTGTMGASSILVHASKASLETSFARTATAADILVPPEESSARFSKNTGGPTDLDDDPADGDFRSRQKDAKEDFWSSKGASLLFALLVLGFVSIAFFFCQIYTVTFFSSRQSGKESIVLAVVFISVMELVNFVAKRAGRGADRAKPSGPSCEISAEICISLFYSVFYRSLFQDLTGWVEFALICLAHVTTQAFIYPVRMTRRYYDISARVVEKLSFIPILSDNSTPEEWNIRMSIDFTIRFLALMASTVAYMISITFVRFGYNSGHYAFFGSNLTDSQFTNLLIFQTISTTVEIVAMIVTVVCTKSLVKGGIIAPCIALLKQYLSYQILFIFAAGHIICDVFLARLVLDTTMPTPVPGQYFN
jgi:hypothetical protein